MKSNRRRKIWFWTKKIDEPSERIFPESATLDVIRATRNPWARVDLIQRRDKANRRGHDMRFAVCHPISSSDIFTGCHTRVTCPLPSSPRDTSPFSRHIYPYKQNASIFNRESAYGSRCKLLLLRCHLHDSRGISQPISHE